MPTRIDWLPYGIKERGYAMTRIASQVDQYGPGLGLTQQQIDRIKAIAEEYNFAVSIYEQNRNINKALRSWRDSVISNKRSNKEMGERPMYNNSPAPAGGKRGLVFEMRKYVRLIKASPQFNSVVAAGMDIMSPNHVKTPLAELKPDIEVKALMGFRIKIACEKQKMDAIRVEYKRNSEETWQNVAFLTSLPETIYIEPAVRGVPETGLVRCWFLKKNKVVGKPSNMHSVTLFGM